MKSKALPQCSSALFDAAESSQKRLESASALL
jgi:hypothetical protein